MPGEREHYREKQRPGGDGIPRRPTFTDQLVQGTRPRTVTVDTARRCKLWQEGTLILETPCGSGHVVGIDSQYVGMIEPSDNSGTRDGKRDLTPGQPLTFVPNK
jgi:hypothetical protein